jgi:hypothetical protein
MRHPRRSNNDNNTETKAIAPGARMRHPRKSNNDDLTGTNLTRPIMMQQLPVANQVVKVDFLEAQLTQAQPGDIITLTEPPATVNVVLVNEEMTLKEDEEDTAGKKALR